MNSKKQDAPPDSSVSDAAPPRSEPDLPETTVSSPIPEQSPSSPAQTEDFLHKVLNNIPQFVFWKDIKSVYLGCNNKFAASAGLVEPEEIVGLTDFDLPWKRKEAEFFRLCDERVMEYDRPEYNIIESQFQADGTTRWLRTNKIPLHDEAGTVIGILGTYDDVTEMIEKEERLQHYEIIASTVDDMMAIIGPDYRYQAVNEAYCAAYAKSRKDIVGLHVSDLIGEELFRSNQKPNMDAALAGGIVQLEGWRMFPGSGKRYVDTTFYPVFSDAGQVTGIVVKVHNSTQTRKLENQLRQAQKMEAIGRLAGGIAHDFNNILSIINGYSDICLFSMDQDNPLRTKIEQIQEAGARAAQLTQQLLAFSRKQIIQPTVISLAAQIQALTSMIERLLGEDIIIETNLPDQIWPIKMDQSQLEQVVLNLAVNARDAITGNGRLTIEVHNQQIIEEYQAGPYSVVPGEYVALIVSDNGSGMTPEVQARIFEPFFTTKPKGDGTGFGLSTVYGIIKQNDGYISVYSEKGEGTTFKILFPRSTDSESIARLSAIEDQQDELIKGEGTILLAEDDHALRTMCVSILKDLGYTVLEAASGKEAVESASRFHGTIDLLLTDVVMPEMSGPETASMLEEHHPDIKVLFMSGYTENAIVHHGVLDEGLHFIQKPITPKKLSLAVARCLGH